MTPDALDFKTNVTTKFYLAAYKSWKGALCYTILDIWNTAQEPLFEKEYKRLPGGSDEHPVVNWRKALRSSPHMEHTTFTKRWNPGLWRGRVIEIKSQYIFFKF